MSNSIPPNTDVWVLAGQSNMEGQAVVDLTGKDYNDGKGTLATLIADPVKGLLIDLKQSTATVGSK